MHARTRQLEQHHDGGDRQPGANAVASFFRAQSIPQTRDSLGVPMNTCTITVTMLTVFLIVIVVSAGTFVATARYARKETVQGQITSVAGNVAIKAKLNGVATKILVREGDKVHAGDQLFLVTSDSALGNKTSMIQSLALVHDIQDQAQQLQAEAKADQIVRQAEEVSVRRDGLQSDILRLDDAIQLLARRKQLHTETYDAHRKLAEQGMLSSASLRQLQDQSLAIDQQTQSIQRDRDLQRNQLKQATAQLLRIKAEADMAKSQAAAMQAQLRERRLNVEAEHLDRVTAPVDGVVTGITAHAGADVSAGQRMATILSDVANPSGARLEVELWAPSKAIGFIKPGATVRVMYDAFPYQTFGTAHGVVKDVSGIPLRPAEVGLPEESREPMFRIRVALREQSVTAYNREWPLIAGMRLTADLVLEEQSLAAWLVGPLVAMRTRSILDKAPAAP